MKIKSPALFFLLCTAAGGRKEELPGLDFDDFELREKITDVVFTESARAGIDPLLIVAVMRVESQLDVNAKSSCGAFGLMQLRFETAHWLSGKEGLPDTAMTDPVVNVQLGIRYLARQIRHFKDVDTALMAYNAGPKRAQELLDSPDDIPDRFLAYPDKVEREYLRLKILTIPVS